MESNIRWKSHLKALNIYKIKKLFIRNNKKCSYIKKMCKAIPQRWLIRDITGIKTCCFLTYYGG